MANHSDRNRAMLVAYEAGRSTELLRDEHGLSCSYISAILTGERHKRQVSPHPFYRSFRQAQAAFPRLDY